MSDFRAPGDGSFGLGSRTWPGMSKLVEECGEVLQIAGKLMMTAGKIEHWDGAGPLDVRMAEEVCDLFAAARAFFQLNGMDGNPVYVQRELRKYQQFLKWHLDNLPEPEDQISPEQHEHEIDVLQEIEAVAAALPPAQTGPIDFPEANGVLVGSPEDRAAGTVVDLPIHRHTDLDGNPHVISKWQLSPDELAEVMRTGVVWLHAWGTTHQPIAVSGASPFAIKKE